MRASKSDAPGRRIPLAPSQVFVDSARAAMGGIDFDPWSTPTYNRLVLARRFMDYELADVDTICKDPWNIPAEGRLFSMLPGQAAPAGKLLYRILQEYRKGRVTQACVMITTPEFLIRKPWVWDFPMAMPFRRPRLRWYDEEFSMFRGITTSAWGVVLYFPISVDVDRYQESMARFYDAFAPSSRIVFNELCGDTAWKRHYETFCGKAFSDSR